MKFVDQRSLEYFDERIRTNYESDYGRQIVLATIAWGDKLEHDFFNGDYLCFMDFIKDNLDRTFEEVKNEFNLEGDQILHAYRLLKQVWVFKHFLH